MIFIDRSIPRSVDQALKLVRSDVRWLEDEFPHDVSDAEWLREIGIRGWLVIGRDRRIRHRPAEKQAILDYDVGYFCIAQDANPTRWEYLRLIVGTLDQMELVFGTVARPFIYGIYRDGAFRRLL
ncbi:MAG: hypothetical protein U0893_24305 [Chloroflexota bacterium]